ncbi:MAG: hypothetical protein A2749_00065 [Parcubacteria group bacterium RIFCSPHIGHO2_01_FULL_45_26]|nr:MAG: hypothetical protein A2749_00065 [Parcubacteria group bacterium RIFCSPHIGHO2_01_FULL_45_26]
MVRNGIFANGEFYHVFNQGVDKRPIVTNIGDSNRFMESLVIFNRIEPVGNLRDILEAKEPNQSRRPLVNIICYCLNPNHFHFILEQVATNGVSEFLRRLTGGYSRYFNKIYKRRGALFQGAYKVKLVSDNDYLLHLSSYVNLNNQVHGLGQSGLIRSSWQEYISNANGICKKGIVLDQFKTLEEFRKFSLDNLVFMKSKRVDYKDLESE